MDQPGKVANPARGQLNRENNIPLSPCVPDNLVSRDGFGRPVPSRVSLLISILRLNMVAKMSSEGRLKLSLTCRLFCKKKQTKKTRITHAPRESHPRASRRDSKNADRGRDRFRRGARKPRDNILPELRMLRIPRPAPISSTRYYFPR